MLGQSISLKEANQNIQLSRIEYKYFDLYKEAIRQQAWHDAHNWSQN